MKAQIDRVQLFKAYLNELFGDEGVCIATSMSKDSLLSFRINYLKVKTAQERLTLLHNVIAQGFDFEPYFLEKNGVQVVTIEESVNEVYAFYVLSKREGQGGLILSKTKEFLEHEIYIQNPSSMLSVFELSPKAETSILDVCAAPGSKTTMIASVTENKANVFAVEKFKPRFFSLKANLEDNGVDIKRLFLSDSIGLDKKYPEYINFFDSVLVDAPCTNESRFNLSDRKSLEFWNPKKYKDLSRVQKGVLITGARMLKPGGTLVYSTCTYNPMENEAVVDWLLSKVPEIEICELALKLEGASQRSVSMLEPFKTYKQYCFDSRVEKTARIMPNGTFEGFFIAKFTKK